MHFEEQLRDKSRNTGDQKDKLFGYYLANIFFTIAYLHSQGDNSYIKQ